MMVLVDFFRAMYEKCGVEWINSTLQARMADPVKAATVTPNAAVADNIVKQKLK